MVATAAGTVDVAAAGPGGASDTADVGMAALEAGAGPDVAGGATLSPRHAAAATAMRISAAARDVEVCSSRRITRIVVGGIACGKGRTTRDARILVCDGASTGALVDAARLPIRDYVATRITREVTLKPMP